MLSHKIFTIDTIKEHPLRYSISLQNPKESMAETETENESTLPSKRKLDDPINESKQEEQNHSNKSQKLQSPTEEENNTDSQTLEPPLAVNRNDAVEAQEDEDDDDDVDYEDEEENGEEAVVVDRKGKGIMIEESGDSDDSDDDDDDSSDGSETDGGDGDNEVDEEENPLAEVDLENILPSRTRRRVVRPGVYIANDNLVNNDDDSDDSDA